MVETWAQERCIKQLALNVEKNAKFHSNLQKAGLFFAKIATQVKKDSNNL